MGLFAFDLRHRVKNFVLRKSTETKLLAGSVKVSDKLFFSENRLGRGVSMTKAGGDCLETRRRNQKY